MGRMGGITPPQGATRSDSFLSQISGLVVHLSEAGERWRTPIIASHANATWKLYAVLVEKVGFTIHVGELPAFKRAVYLLFRSSACRSFLPA